MGCILSCFYTCIDDAISDGDAAEAATRAEALLMENRINGAINEKSVTASTIMTGDGYGGAVTALLEMSAKSPLLMHQKLVDVRVVWEEEDEEAEICATCLDGYDAENPKIDAVCGHHYHLACMLEWAERKPTCPLCDRILFV